MIKDHRKTTDKTTQALPPSTSGSTLRPTSGVGKAVSRETLCPGRPDRLPTVEARFWARVHASGGADACWPWTGPVNKTNGYGYASFWDGGRSRHVGAHRLAYVLAVGEVPAGLLVCHACDNRLCCNPAHLWLGTYRDNTRDMMRKLRGGNTKLSPERVRDARARYAAGGVTQRDLAEQYGVSAAHVSSVIHGKFWREVA